MKKYWVETYCKMKNGKEYKACYECDDYYFQNERLGKHIVMVNCNDADTGKQFKRNKHKLVEKCYMDEYTETVIFENGTDNVILKIVQ